MRQCNKDNEHGAVLLRLQSSSFELGQHLLSQTDPSKMRTAEKGNLGNEKKKS